MVHYILLTCSLMIAGLYTASGNAECNLNISKNIRNKDNFFLGKIDRRYYVEYHVTYINAFKEPVPLGETNTSRFQPMRWFNIHIDVEKVLPVTYDFLFNIFQRVFHIQREYVEINVTPLNCIYTIDFEKLEELTRNLFLDVSGTLSNPLICSAHIDDNNGKGMLIFNCCTTEHLCHTVVDHFKWQQILHGFSITATVIFLISVFVLIYSNPSIGTDEFTFQRNNRDTHVSPQGVEIHDSLCNAIEVKSREKAAINAAREAHTAVILLDTKSETTVKNKQQCERESLLAFEVKPEEDIKLRVFKERCVDESNLAITFRRCFTEFLTGLNKSFCKTKTNEKMCRDTDRSRKCCCSCNCSLRFIIGRTTSFLFSSLVLLPFVLIGIEYNKENTDYNELCAAYKDRGYTCPFNVIEIPKQLTWAVVGLYVGAKLLYSCVPINYLKMTVCRVPGISKKILNCCKNCGKSECYDETISCLKFIITEHCCKFYHLLQFGLNVSYQMIIYLTWGLSLYTLFYFIFTVIMLSTNTKHKLDDIVLIFFPLAVIVYEYIQNVTHKYKVITEKILTLIRTDPEFKCLPSEHKDNIAILLLGANKKIEEHTESYGCRNRLKLDRPFIFLEANGNVLISKRLVSQIYNDTSEFSCCEFSAYLKALLLCILPAFAYGCLLYLLITYISIFSFSNDVAGYVVSVATYLQLIKYKLECFLRDFLLKDSSSDPRFLEKFRKHLNSFTESWTIVDDKCNCCFVCKDNNNQGEHSSC